MPIPDATLKIIDGQLGLLPQDTSGLQALIGTSSLGTVGQVNEFGTITAVRTALGVGPLVEAAALVFANGAGPVICVKATSTTAGAAGSVTPVGTGTSVVTVAGATTDAYNVIVLIKTGAAAVTSGIGTFVYSLDGGATYSGEISLPVAGAYVLPNTGATITFATGTLVAGDTYAFVTTGPSYSLSDCQVALTALLADPRTWFLVHVIGTPADASASAALFSALDTALAAAAAAYRYTMAAMQAADTTDSNLITAFSALVSTRVAVCAGFAMVTSPISGGSFKRPASWLCCARAGSVTPATDIARVKDGPLLAVNSILRDEAVTPGLDVTRFTTLRTIIGLPGFYVTNGRMFSSPTSDYRYWQHRRVMDIASITVRAAQLQYLNDQIVVNGAQSKSPGTIREEDARGIDSSILSAMRAALSAPGFASGVSCMVNRTDNILSTSVLRVDYGVIPLGYLKQIQGTIGFSNPAIVQAS